MKIKPTIKNQKGAAVVEFAIVLPLLALLAFGTCEFGLLCYNAQIITNASREGARAGIIRDSDFFLGGNAIKQIVIDYCAQRLIDFGGTTLTVDDIDIVPNDDTVRKNAAFGSDFSVTVTYKYHFVVPRLFGLVLPYTPIKRLTLMKMERVP